MCAPETRQYNIQGLALYACAAHASDAAAPARTDGMFSVRWSNQRSYRRGRASRASAGYASTNLPQARHAASRTCKQKECSV